MCSSRLTMVVFAALIATVFTSQSIGIAQVSPAAHQPRICTGMRVENGVEKWGMIGNGSCAANSAALGAFPITDSRYDPARRVGAYLDCCPLPASDILLEEHVFTYDSCPDGYVVTGGVGEGYSDSLFAFSFCRKCDKQLRCTKVNPRRYQLGPTTDGAFWGIGSNYYFQPLRFMHADLPPALRYGLSRKSQYTRFRKGCVGQPFGSLLIAKSSKRCSGMKFRQLQYTGAQGDPPNGTPVELFPKCTAVYNQFDKNPECRR